MMQKSTVVYGVGLLVLALLLWTKVRGSVSAYATPPVVLPGLPNVTYDIPAPIVSLPNGSAPPLLYDWLGEQCGCDVETPSDVIVIDSVKYTRDVSSYQYMGAPNLDYLAALKGAANLTQNNPPPAPIVYRAATPSFWWGWTGFMNFTRCIYTSDGFILPVASQDQGGVNRAASLDSRTWADVTPGRNALTQITVIRFNAQDYILDASRSTGL